MKHSLISLVFLSLILFSCERKQQFPYEYDTNPQYTQGYVDFWGPYYSSYDITNNVLSLTALTDSLLINEEGQLYGFGQYLFLEDVFLLPTDTLFPEGVYQVSASGEAFTIAPGELYTDKKAQNGRDTIDYNITDVGARIYFYEPIESKSIRKFIIDGSMIVTLQGQYTRFIFDFILDDKNKTELKGSFYSKDLYYYDMSHFAPVIGRQKGRLKNIH